MVLRQYTISFCISQVDYAWWNELSLELSYERHSLNYINFDCFKGALLKIWKFATLVSHDKSLTHLLVESLRKINVDEWFPLFSVGHQGFKFFHLVLRLNELANICSLWSSSFVFSICWHPKTSCAQLLHHVSICVLKMLTGDSVLFLQALVSHCIVLYW